MYDYTLDATDFSANTPWFESADYIDNIKVEEGITYIGDNAFVGLVVGSIEIPISVTEIGDGPMSRKSTN